MDGADSSPEVEQVAESTVMGETRRTLIAALTEEDQTLNIAENKLLKESWITEAVAKLDQPIMGETGSVITYVDANLALQNERGFAGIYLKKLLGSKIDVMDLKEIVRGDRKLPVIKRSELDFPEEPRLAWVENDGGKRNLISTTKIDGVQVEIDMHGVGKGPETIGVLHPILRLSTK